MTASSSSTAADPWPARALYAAIALFVAVRVTLFPFARNYVGDAVWRLDLARAWAAHPHVIRHAGEVFEIGPLHVYLAGLAIRFTNLEPGGRLPNLLLGCLLLVPLIRLARRTKLPYAPALAVGSMAVCSLHVQSSTAASSEALFLTFLFVAYDAVLDLCATGRLRFAVLAGLATMAGAALRYDGWMIAGLLAAYVGFAAVLPRGSLTRHRSAAAVFVALACAFPVVWMVQNARWLGSPFWTFQRHETYHRAMAAGMVARAGLGWHRFTSATFWPVHVVQLVSPGVALLGTLGAWSRRRERWVQFVVGVTALPALYLTYRAAIRLDFGLIARFTIAAAAVTTLFVAAGLDAVARRAPRAAPWVLALTLAMAVVQPVVFALRTHGHGDLAAEQLRPVSPMADLPPALEQATRWLHDRRDALDGQLLFADSDGGFGVGSILFQSDLPHARWIRGDWSTWRDAVVASPPVCAVLFRGGRAGDGLDLTAARIPFAGRVYQHRAWFDAPPRGTALGVYCREP